MSQTVVRHHRLFGRDDHLPHPVLVSSLPYPALNYGMYAVNLNLSNVNSSA